jgi:hypothetical protein
MSMSSESGPSMASSGSVELLSYQDALESVLTWLLEAEEVIDKQQPIASNVATVKDQFNQHEVRSGPAMTAHGSLPPISKKS